MKTTPIKNFKFILFLLPLLEIAMFILVGKLIGVLPTLALIVLTTIIGFVIIRNKNTTALQKMNLQNGQNVIFNLMEHSITVFSGLLLIIPGFITDIIGLLLLIPSCRSFLLKLFIAKSNIKPSQHTKKDNDVIEGECWHEENDDNKPNT